jgi:hypothetical protein
MEKFEIEILSKLLTENGFGGYCGLLETSKPYIEFSGAGYFLSIKDESLPSERTVLDNPKIDGKLGEFDVGFLAFIEDSELTLECYSYENEIVNKHREQTFVQSAT